MLLYHLNRLTMAVLTDRVHISRCKNSYSKVGSDREQFRWGGCVGSTCGP